MKAGNSRKKWIWIFGILSFLGVCVAVSLITMYLMFSSDLRRGRCSVAMREFYAQEGLTLSEFKDRKTWFLSDSREDKDACKNQGLRELKFEAKSTQVTGVYLIGGQEHQFSGTVE